MAETVQPLHPIEKRILKTLSSRGVLKLEQITEVSGLAVDQVRRGIEWLKAKNFVEVRETDTPIFSLGAEGQVVAAEGLPERRLVELLKKMGGSSEISSLSKSLGPEFTIALGNAKKNKWILVGKNAISLTSISAIEEPEEQLLEKLRREEILPKESLTEGEFQTISRLKNRRPGFVNEVHEKMIEVQLSDSGKKILTTVDENEIERITPEVLRSGEWKNRNLRALDVVAPAPLEFPGRRHPMRLFMNEVREAFISLGFEEILGPISQTALWNFDALFIPQQHSAREMQDTFYLSNVHGDLNKYREEVSAIKSTHETGAGTGSLGWGYSWSDKEASRVVLRTHTTAVTISYLSEKKPDEARVFSVGRVFRNEKSNYKHNPEFYQIEGVMVGEKLNLRNLIYILTKFYSKLGFNEIKFWPTFFPYTEPSLQTMVFRKDSGKWMELGGMGVFRPEVTIPLGVKNPVLAWGLSLDRLVMLRYGLNDIRHLFGANLDWLRNLKITRD
ncbi:MAG: phenylalanine--tRNA ligase subunit alpha [Thaumarchaeota archaeon]|nr:phenylalanine--tRNA ligase subunit alpha [Nitrososphaerota archaeon]